MENREIKTRRSINIRREERREEGKKEWEAANTNR